jgi:tripartite-type tricarboxylate transporter receptor subunit TctC
MLLAVATSGCALTVAPAVAQQAYPDRPLRIVVPYAPGGPTDIVARAIGQKMKESIKQPVIIDNRPGANEIIAADLVAKATADGHTLLFATDAALSLNAYLYTKLPYNVDTDFVPVSRLFDSHMVLVGPADSAIDSLNDLVARAKQAPGTLNYASSGIGNSSHLAMEWFNSLNEMKLNHVPYKGVAAVVPDLVAGRVAATFSAVVAVLPHIRDGRLRALAMSGSSRFSLLPTVPTFAELGYPNFQAFFYLGAVAPKGTPAEILNKLSAELRKVVQDSEFRNRSIQTWGLVPVGDSPAEFAEFLKTDRARAAKIIKLSGVKLD